MSKCLTPEFRCSFFDLFEPKVGMADDGKEGKLGFRLDMLFPKSIKMSDLRDMEKLYNDTVPHEWKAGGVPYRTFKECFINGDKKKQDSRKGCWILRAQSGADYAPRLLLENKAVAKKGEIYGGAYARAILSAFPWTYSRNGVVVKRGVSFNLLTVQRTRPPLADGSDRFGRFVSAEEQDELLDAAPLAIAEGEDLLA